MAIKPDQNTSDFQKKALEDFDQQEEIIKQKVQDKQGSKANQTNRRRLLKYIFITICLITIIYQIPTLRSTVNQTLQPNRIGSYDTDSSTDECIHTLWKIVKHLQLEKELTDDFFCPVTNTNYIITPHKSFFTIMCPNPENHGFSAIQVSTKTMVPELIK